MKLHLKVIATASVVALLAACGGGGGGASTAGPEVTVPEATGTSQDTGLAPNPNGFAFPNFGAAGTKIIKSYDVFQPTGGYFYLDQKTEWVHDATFVKLREIALSYTLPDAWARKVGAQKIILSGFMKNIILYAANGTNQDPEGIYNQQLNGNTMQGFVLWNASPIIMPSGFKINVSF